MQAPTLLWVGPEERFTFECRSGTLDPYVLEWMSRMEARGMDWTGSMAPRFPAFLAWKLVWETHFLRRREGLGVLTAVARPGG